MTTPRVPFLFARPPFPSSIPNALESSDPATTADASRVQPPSPVRDPRAAAGSVLVSDDVVRRPDEDYFPAGHAVPCSLDLLKEFGFTPWVAHYNELIDLRSQRQRTGEHADHHNDDGKERRHLSPPSQKHNNDSTPVILDEAAVVGAHSDRSASLTALAAARSAKIAEENAKREHDALHQRLQQSKKIGISSWAPLTPVSRRPVLARKRINQSKSSRREAKEQLKAAEVRMKKDTSGEGKTTDVNKIRESLTSALNIDADSDNDENGQMKVQQLRNRASKIPGLPFIISPFGIRELWTKPIPDYADQMPVDEGSLTVNQDGSPAFLKSGQTTPNVMDQSGLHLEVNEGNSGQNTPTPQDQAGTTPTPGSNLNVVSESPGDQQRDSTTSTAPKIRLRTKFSTRPGDEERRKKLFYYLDKEAAHGPLQRFIGTDKEKQLVDVFYMQPGLLSNHPEALNHKNRVMEEYKHALQMYERDTKGKRKLVDGGPPPQPKFIDYDVEDFVSVEQRKP